LIRWPWIGIDPARMPKAPRQPKPLYRRKPPKPADASLIPGTPLAPAHFVLREDGGIAAPVSEPAREDGKLHRAGPEDGAPTAAPRLVFQSESPFVRLYHGNCFELLDAIAAKYPGGRFDCIFADPPYFLSNGGITCHAGRMVRVDKGDWDKSRGADENHNFNREWLARCQRVLKSNGTLWVSGTHHVIFSIGFALQQLGFKILNDIAWEKPSPPPNLSCRYFTHSTETLLWAAKSEQSKHTFNYQAMRQVTGKQMKTVWTMTAPGSDEKTLGKHPTQKPVALIERCLRAATNEGDLVLDPFLGGGTTAVACVRLRRGCVGIEMEEAHARLATSRTDGEIITVWLREFRVGFEVAIFLANDLDPLLPNMDRIAWMKEPEPKTDCIFHETKFVFLSCAAVSSAAVVHTTVETTLQEAWAKTPNGKKRETTHIVRCQTEILRVKGG
jgi:site-specific DNA-methyltransferase (adenine-specific)